MTTLPTDIFHTARIEHITPVLTALPTSQSPAEWMHERLVKQIAEFESALTDDEEISGRLVSAPSEGSFHIEDVGFWGPDMIIFHGKNQHGRPVQLLQHYSQLNVLLTALPKESASPRRIGFMLEQRLTSGDESSDHQD
jgi:hypothetical protein